MSDSPSEGPGATKAEIIDEMLTIAMVAGQYSVEVPDSPTARASAAEAERCARWAKALQATPPSPSSSAALAEVLKELAELTRDCIRRHDSWCGYKAGSPGDGIVNRAAEAADRALAALAASAPARALEGRCPNCGSNVRAGYVCGDIWHQRDEVDEEMVPHRYEFRIPEDENWCAHCEYHKDHAIHAASSVPAAPQQNEK
jgi:hypothetical protein